jgi:curved DNA-binding protein CbpA
MNIYKGLQKMSKAKKFVMEKGYYELLEIAPTATTVEIQRSFERLCDEYVNISSDKIEIRKKSAEILFALTKAYEILTDPFQRLSYDERRFPLKQPFNNDVETIFKEGLRAFRNNEINTAVRFFKEAVNLLPHKTTYRVHLAIAYHEKGWKEYAEKELRMALKLDPKNEFAQEVVARLLFNVSDKKLVGFFVHKVNRQIAAVAAVSILTCGILVNGVPKAMAALQRAGTAASSEIAQKKSAELQSQLPADMRQAMAKQETEKTVKNNVKVAKLDDSFMPEGQVYNYTEQVAVKKTYYPGQNLIIVDYKGGTILTYKPQDLIGWKIDAKTNVPVVITKGNEIIPVPVDLPVTLASGKSVNPDDADFPADAFPEYQSTKSAADSGKIAETGSNPVPETNNVITAPPQALNINKNAPAGLPPAVSNPGA